MGDLIGKKVRGFKFENREFNFSPLMEKHIGKIGTITRYDKYLSGYVVKFDLSQFWNYPADQIEKHLVKELPKSFACTNTNQKLWDKYIKWLNKEHNGGFNGSQFNYYGINKDEYKDCCDSKDRYGTILSLKEWDEIVNPKSKQLPKSFACRNTNQKLWDKYVSWFNTMSSKNICGDSDIYSYYGITTNGVYDCHKSIDYYDTILSLEEWDEIVNGTQTKKEETMKNYTITREQLEKIHNVACSSWQELILGYSRRNPFGNTIEFTQAEVDEMFTAATTSQTPVLENIFGKQTNEIDLSTGKVDDRRLFDNNGNLHSALICVRTAGHYKNKAFILNNDFNWNIWGDDNGQLCLVPTRK